jgi:TPR repeat protein
MRFGLTAAAAGLLMTLFAGAGSAHDYRSGVAAYKRGDYQTALSVFMPLARAGDPIAQHNVAVMYDDGRGLPENYRLALKWYLRAADQGLADSQFMAGMHYAAGRGRPQDPAHAYCFLSLAAAGNYPHAERARDQEESYLTPKSRARAQDLSVAWLKKRRAQFNCGSGRCIHPKWIDKPRYSIFD